MPIGPHGDKGWTQSNDDVFVIYKQSKYPDAAAEFVKFYYAKETIASSASPYRSTCCL